jgi:hypothetical protein
LHTLTPPPDLFLLSMPVHSQVDRVLAHTDPPPPPDLFLLSMYACAGGWQRPEDPWVALQLLGAEGRAGARGGGAARCGAGGLRAGAPRCARWVGRLGDGCRNGTSWCLLLAADAGCCLYGCSCWAALGSYLVLPHTRVPTRQLPTTSSACPWCI